MEQHEEGIRSSLEGLISPPRSPTTIPSICLFDFLAGVGPSKSFFHFFHVSDKKRHAIVLCGMQRAGQRRYQPEVEEGDTRGDTWTSVSEILERLEKVTRRND
jgi:hypothetical protein